MYHTVLSHCFAALPALFCCILLHPARVCRTFLTNCSTSPDRSDRPGRSQGTNLFLGIHWTGPTDPTDPVVLCDVVGATGVTNPPVVALTHLKDLQTVHLHGPVWRLVDWNFGAAGSLGTNWDGREWYL
eukprot:gene3578-biopygen23254